MKRLLSTIFTAAIALLTIGGWAVSTTASAEDAGSCLDPAGGNHCRPGGG